MYTQFFQSYVEAHVHSFFSLSNADVAADGSREKLHKRAMQLCFLQAIPSVLQPSRKEDALCNHALWQKNYNQYKPESVTVHVFYI